MPLVEDMRVIYPRKAEQENGFDCGVYLLHYVEEILSRYYIAQLRPSSSLAEPDAVFSSGSVGWLGGLSHSVAQHWDKLQTSSIQFWKGGR